MCKILGANGRLLERGSKEAAGYDLYSAEDTWVEGMGLKVVGTEIALGIPKGTYGRIAPCSGLAVRNMIGIGAGVVDRDYTGEIKVVLLNHSNDSLQVKKGDRIVQLILEKIITPKIKKITKTIKTKRGKKGFGSTGVRDVEMTNVGDEMEINGVEGELADPGIRFP